MCNGAGDADIVGKPGAAKGRPKMTERPRTGRCWALGAVQRGVVRVSQTVATREGRSAGRANSSSNSSSSPPPLRRAGVAPPPRTAMQASRGVYINPRDVWAVRPLIDFAMVPVRVLGRSLVASRPSVVPRLHSARRWVSAGAASEGASAVCHCPPTLRAPPPPPRPPVRAAALFFSHPRDPLRPAPSAPHQVLALEALPPGHGLRYPRHSRQWRRVLLLCSKGQGAGRAAPPRPVQEDDRYLRQRLGCDQPAQLP